MTRVTATFLVLLLIATLTLGITWRQIEELVAGRGIAESGIALAVSGALLLMALLGLGRILYVTTRVRRSHSQSSEEA